MYIHKLCPYICADLHINVHTYACMYKYTCGIKTRGYTDAGLHTYMRLSGSALHWWCGACSKLEAGSIHVHHYDETPRELSVCYNDATDVTPRGQSVHRNHDPKGHSFDETPPAFQ